MNAVFIRADGKSPECPGFFVPEACSKGGPERLRGCPLSCDARQAAAGDTPVGRWRRRPLSPLRFASTVLARNGV